MGSFCLPSAAREPRHPCQWQAETKAPDLDREGREGRSVCVHQRGRCPSPGSTGSPLAYPWPLPGSHLGVEWYVPVCSLSWLLCSQPLVPCSEAWEEAGPRDLRTSILVFGEATFPYHSPARVCSTAPAPLPQGIKQGLSQGLRGTQSGPTLSCVSSHTVQVPIGFSPK